MGGDSAWIYDLWQKLGNSEKQSMTRRNWICLLVCVQFTWPIDMLSCPEAEQLLFYVVYMTDNNISEMVLYLAGRTRVATSRRYKTLPLALFSRKLDCNSFTCVEFMPKPHLSFVAILDFWLTLLF